jgi:Protein of unknown function (DUF1236)
MRISPRAVLLLALTCAPLALIGHGIGQVAPGGGAMTARAGAADDPADGFDGIGIASARALPLTDEQRGHIFDGIMRVRDVPEISVPASATALPTSVALQDLPASVTSDIPLTKGYKFVKLDDRILLVSPVDRSVVAVMPRYRLIID